MARMARVWSAASLVILGATGAACSRAIATDSPAPAPAAATKPSEVSPSGADLEVHEWGTFTTMQGSAWGSADGLQHESEALPAFVHSRLGASRESPFRAYGDTSLDEPAHDVNAKMETPILYFHTKTPLRVNVHVDFPHGLLTQFYPAPREVLPALARSIGATPLDVSKIATSSLEWQIDLAPQGKPAPGRLPEVAAGDPWQLAREVDAAYVRTDEGEVERYLFYRGLGRVDLPIIVRPAFGGEAVVYNCGPQAVDAAFAIEMAGGRGRFARLGAMAAHGTAVAKLSSVPLQESANVVRDLEREVETALVSAGLFGDEARAMVRTWSRTWFAADGTRVLYLVPRARTDALLPIRIAPQPDKLVRVLVARHEYLTREAEADLDAALRDRASGSSTAREAAMKRIAHLGRFVEPAVRDALRRATDPSIRKAAEEILAAYL